MTGILPRWALGSATRLNYVTKGSGSSFLQIRDTEFNADVSDFLLKKQLIRGQNNALH